MKTKNRFTQEQKDFLKKELVDKTASEVSNLFFERYGRRLTTNNLNVFKFNNKIAKNKYYDSKFNEEQKKYLKKYLPYHNNEEAVEMLKNKYGLEVKVSSLKNFRHWYHIERKYKHHSDKYGKPITKELYNEIEDGLKGTMVRIGTRKYQYKRRYVWEQYYGRKIPKDYCVIFLNEKNNYDINNLALVKKGTLSYSVKKGIELCDKDIIKTIDMVRLLEKKAKNKMEVY